MEESIALREDVMEQSVFFVRSYIPIEKRDLLPKKHE